MPTPFEILAQGDANTRALFSNINAGLETVAKGQERAINQAATLAIAKENVLQNRAKLDFEEQKFKVSAVLDAARLNLSSAQSAARLQQSIMEFSRLDRKHKHDVLSLNAESMRNRAQAAAIADWDFDAINDVEDQILKERNAIENTDPGDMSFLQGSIKRITEAGTTFAGVPISNLFIGGEASVFGGENDPNDSGISAFGRKTGPGGDEGVAVPKKILKANGFPTKASQDGAKVRVRTTLDDGTIRDFTHSVVDLGPSEGIFEEKGTSVLDFTEGAIRNSGGRALKDGSGKITGVAGIKKVDFEILPPGSEATIGSNVTLQSNGEPSTDLVIPNLDFGLDDNDELNALPTGSGEDTDRGLFPSSSASDRKGSLW